jgi:hypothetical protein
MAKAILSIVCMSLIIATALLVAAPAAVAASCHNATGSCAKNHFVCANEEMVPHAKRCDGVEDCADGTDEFMCDQSSKPLAELAIAERNAITEASCVFCTCKKGTIIVPSTNVPWFKIALTAPRDAIMMTNAPGQNNKPCNPASVSVIKLNVYKKQNKGCRGWVCCFRQEECSTCSAGGSPGTHCY